MVNRCHTMGNYRIIKIILRNISNYMGCVYMEVLKRYIFTCSMGSTIWNKQKKTSIGKRWEGNLTELIFDKFSTFSHFLKVFIMNMDYFWRIKKKKTPQNKSIQIHPTDKDANVNGGTTGFLRNGVGTTGYVQQQKENKQALGPCLSLHTTWSMDWNGNVKP